MNGETQAEGQEKEDVGLEDIQKKCLDSLGYVVYVSVLTPRRIEGGANEIRSFYLRSNFSFEDTKNAIKGFEKAFREDIESL